MRFDKRRQSSAVCMLLVIAAMSRSPAAQAPAFPGPDPGDARASIAEGRLTLENNVLAVVWDTNDRKLRPAVVVDKLSSTAISGLTELVALTLEDGRRIATADLAMIGRPQIERLLPQTDSVRFADRYGGWSIAASLADANDDLRIHWKAVLRDDAHYVRQSVRLEAVRDPIPIAAVTLVDLQCPDAKVTGTVAGSPVTGKGMFFAYEHPNSRSLVEPGGRVRCSLERHTPLEPNQPLAQSSVIGVAPAGQMRRAFALYIERERPRPFAPFLHYNSWYDIAWGDRKMNERQCLEVIRLFGQELWKKRGVALDAFVFDDGWDDNKTLWGFHEGFPNGFGPLVEPAKKVDSAVGVWLSPWGGYGQAKAERIEYGRTQGFEINRNGFSLAGSKYYARFRDVCAAMIRKYGVNYFKFDGVGIGNNRDGADDAFLPDIEGLLRLCSELRELRPDVYLSITTGTWPSPYWLFHGDSIWRNGADCDFHGEGTMRQRWITYRDMITYRMILRRAPLYPLNSLMVQGICYAQLGTATRMGDDLKDLVDEMQMLFGSGTQLQELYVTPQMMTPPMWDALAETAAWSRRNADVLADVHWVGGDPGEAEAYGYASWSPRKGILVLRNPSQRAARLNVDLKAALELPPDAHRRYDLEEAWAPRSARISLEAGQPHTFELEPFQVLAFEVLPAR